MSSASRGGKGPGKLVGVFGKDSSLLLTLSLSNAPPQGEPGSSLKIKRGLTQH